MNNRANIEQTLQIGTCVAIFLQNTECNQQAIELCKECLVLLNNSALGIGDQVTKTYKCNIYNTMLKAYKYISDYINAERCARELLPILHDLGETEQEGIVRFKLAEMYCNQRKFEQARKLYEIAVGNMKAIGKRRGEADGYNALGSMSNSLHEYLKAKEYFEKALAINIEIGDKGGEAINYGNIGRVLQSLCEYQKAKEYHEKALAISMEIGDKGGEAKNCGNLGRVLHSLGGS